MTQPDLRVDPARVRSCATQVRAAADAVASAREKEAPPLLAAGGDAGWATIAAMRTCATSVDGDLGHQVTGLRAYAGALDTAMRGYRDADERAAQRQRQAI